MKTIWKFKIPQCERSSIEMPKDAKILAVGNQYEVVCLWAEVDPKNDTVSRMFRIIGTGHSVPDELLEYIGTVQMTGGNFIWHIYEQLS